MKLPYVLLGAALVFAVALAVSTVFDLGGGSARTPEETTASAATATPAAMSTPPAETELPVPDPPGGPLTLPLPSHELAPPSLIQRLAIPKLGIDAAVVVLGVGEDGVMQSPESPDEVAWYDFAARPGEGSNVVLSGHLDYVDHGPAVFFRLEELANGDEIQLTLADGSLATYVVSSSETYDAVDAPVQAIVGPTASEVVTLITCGGSFDPASASYSQRLVVRGDRVEPTVATN